MNVFGENTFTESNLKKRVPKKVFEEFKLVQSGKKELTRENADIIANAIKDWATKRNATHFCHWFQPLTDLTAEKHDSFIEPSGDKEILYRFSGINLIKGESDASSFPNGGLRSTFEARGYTVWDTNSPPFIRENEVGATLYIPTSFISFNGEALDKKLPLLKSMKRLDKVATRLLNILGYDEVKSVKSTLGVEQEYFLVKKEYFDKRVDLLFTGRTLIGSKSPKNQESSYHYYGKIKDNVINFMAKLDYELWKFGIASKTRHNEVAPNQFEVASIFDMANLAADQNQILMETLEKLAIKHGFVALLHEKPFEYVNGSGKHNNWSISTDTGVNLFDPKSPTFLIFLSAMIEAVDRYYPILRAVIASNSNDYRLGGHEAPPSIISVFLGNHLTQKLENYDVRFEDDRFIINISNEKINENITNINIKKDFDDRNRTSPFAFTGNKFEFRMSGSSSSPSNTAMVINTIMATVLSEYVDILEKSSDLEESLKNILKNSYINHSRIIFNGDGYSSDWHNEATIRGLKNARTTFEALSSYLNEEIIEMFEKNGILTKEECEARYKAYMSRYIQDRLTEANTLLYMIDKYVYDYSFRYLDLVKINSLQEKIIGLLNELEKKKSNLEDIINSLNLEDMNESAKILSLDSLKLEKEIRIICDNLERIIPENIWNIPTYTELLYKL